ncbi:MAG TPA: cupin domain-containing protein [Rhizomicrobium sp.]|nr:cupin domain-containing protein [Rhizomicrobium sp.]
MAFSDHRGAISDIVTKENIGAVTIITTRKGAVRGNHYHKETWQYLYVLSGKLRAVAQNPGEAPTEAILLPGDLILDVPNQRHAFEGLEDSTCLVLTRGVREGDDYEKDTFRLDIPLIKPA